jgi:superfamily II DNA or RNA helicase
VKLPKNVRLWKHQADAVAIVAPFLQKHGGKRVVGRPSALVNIPTGGGKTAVIGALGHWHPAMGRVLVVAPRTAIRIQLALELSARRGFFLRCGFAPDSLPKKVIALNSATDLPSRVPDDVIFVSTIQLVNDMAGNRPGDGAYDRLAANCDAVIVDEGHYEPALSWSRALRGLGRPIVLVTATPYRNDLKPFEFDKSALYISKYSELMAENILRKVEVVQASPQSVRDPAAFVDSVLTEFTGYYGAAPDRGRKLIVRCRSQEQVRLIGDLMRNHRHGGGGVICLHEAFTPDPARSWEKRQPTDPEASDAPAIWVHQHKLLEGVDGPSFRAVAFYGVLGSARALVQQIGRVIRNPQRRTDESALMIDHSDGYLADMWQRFLEYDAAVDGLNMLEGIDDFAKAFEQGLPPVVYADRQFRRRYSFGGPADRIKRSLRLPLRCHLYSAKRGARLSALATATEGRLREAEFPFQTVFADDGEILILFVKLQNSALLAEHYFFERELHAFVAVRKGSLVAVLDTSRPGLDGEASAIIGKPLEREKIARLLMRSPNTRLVEINSRNAALGPSVVRRRSSAAASLEETPPSLDEFQFVPSSLTAVDPGLSRIAPGADPDEDSFSIRSVGFGLGRITDASVRKKLVDWNAWITRLAAASSDASRPAPVYLDRFARQLEQPPDRPWPRSVLLDTDEARALFVTVGDVPEPLDVEDVCLECRAAPGSSAGDAREVVISANGTDCAGTFEYDRAAERYMLESRELERLYRHEDGTTTGNLVSFLNARQAFVVVPESPDAIFSEGSFFDPRLGLGRRFDPEALGLTQMIDVFPALRTCTSEKGGRNSAVPAGWPAGSVFQWIDRNWSRLLPDAELVVCDDGRNEACDFILAGKRNGRDVVVMVHAKASKQPAFVSASKLHEVCGQAAKQVGTLAQFGARRPVQVALWHKAWDGPGGEGRVDRRIRRNLGDWAGLTGPQIWNELQEILARPGTEREVALVLGAALDRDRLFAQARRNAPPAPAVHCIHLLRSTMAAVGGVNARLRILSG